MYVAITRARKRLYLSHSQTRMLHGQTRYNIKSRFFDELPEDNLKWIAPRAPAGGGLSGGFKGGGSGWNAASSRGTGATAPWAASAPVPPRKDDGNTVRAGMQVFHNKFGEGKVVTVEGSGADARAQINFPRHGTKWLALSVAKLTPVE